MANKVKNHVVSLSGGGGSWLAAYRVAQWYPEQNLTMLFCDTLIEDNDTYRFLIEGAAVVCEIPLDSPEVRSMCAKCHALPNAPDGNSLEECRAIMEQRAAALAELREEAQKVLQKGTRRLVWLADGRYPWQVVARFLSHRNDDCSRILKRDFANKWIRQNFLNSDTVLYWGIDIWEENRYSRGRMRSAKRDLPLHLTLLKLHFLSHLCGIEWKFLYPVSQDDVVVQLECGPFDKSYKTCGKEGYVLMCPLCDKPAMKGEARKTYEALGIKHQQLYLDGFDHANCGGWCIKAGKAHYANLAIKRPRTYAWHEREEADAREEVGNHTILRELVKGKMIPLTMTELRERVESKGQGANLFEDDPLAHSGCGCMLDD